MQSNKDLNEINLKSNFCSEKSDDKLSQDKCISIQKRNDTFTKTDKVIDEISSLSQTRYHQNT